MDPDDFYNTFFDVGDFNIDQMKNEVNSTSTFLDILIANLFLPHIIILTRITSSSKYILSNSLNLSLAIAGVLSNTISDHLPQ